MSNNINHLGRTASHRKALMSNMASDLILRKRITTTTAKAKALRPFVEPIINKSKENTTHSRRIVFSYLQNKYAVNELFKEVAVRIINRPGGYTRILKTGFRAGDNAEMCIIELVDYNENMLTSPQKSSKTNKKSRRGGNKNKDKAVTENSEKEEYKIKHPEKLSKINNSLLQYNKDMKMKAIQEIGTHKYSYDIDISLNDEDNILVRGNEYFLEIGLKIKDELKRKALLETFSVYFYTNKYDIASHETFHKFEFKDDNYSKCKFNFVPDELGETEFNLDFYQNSKMFHKKKFKINTVAPEYAL